MAGQQVKTTGERVDQERRLNGQKIALAWLVYALALALLLLVSFCGLSPNAEAPQSGTESALHRAAG